MTTIVLHALNKLKKYISEKLSSYQVCLRHIVAFTVPDSNEFDLAVCKLVKRTEKLAIVFQLDINGPSQRSVTGVNAFGYRRYKWMDWLITINVLMSVTRFIVLTFSTSDSVAIYLGDPLFRVEDRQVLLVWFAMAMSIMFIFREWILNLNAKGRFEILSTWKVCCNGFDSSNLQMSNLVARRFRLTIFLFSIFVHNVMLLIPFFLSLLLLVCTLSNPWIFKMPKLAFFAFVLGSSSIFVGDFLLAAVIGFFWYIACSIYFHLFRLYDLLHCAKDLNHRLVGGKQLGSFCVSIIRHLNEFEAVSHKFRYLLLYYVSIFAAAGDFDIFLGMIVKVYNDFLANLLTILGFFILLSSLAFSLIFGDFISQVNMLTVKLHQLSTKSRLTMGSANKVLEVMDRAAGPYNGIKIGDFVTLEKSFAISFLLENMSILMLFICNIGPYLGSYKSSA
uniref:Gustatory receptor n=1 Tax=Tetranychus urticae TaxID=32264 RepID=A0A158P588_TETUR